MPLQRLTTTLLVQSAKHGYTCMRGNPTHHRRLYQEMHGQLYIIDENDGSSRRPMVGSLPWPVLLWLASRSNKFISVDNSFPRFPRYHAAINDLEQKVLWNSLGKVRQESWRFKWGEYRPVGKCQHLVLPETRAYAADLRKQLVDVLHSSVARARRRKEGARLRPRFELYAARWLLEHGIVAAQTDKDGGFALLKHSHAIRMLEAKLVLPLYREFLPPTSHTSTVNRMVTLL